MKPIWTVIALLTASIATAQTGPQFDVASVKALTTGGGRGGMKGGPGTDDPTRFSWPSATLQRLLVKAYDVNPDQISGPGWITEARYAVVANVPADATKEQFQLMLRNLLISRFQLKLRTSTKEFTVYNLTVAPGGPKLKVGAAAQPPDLTGMPAVAAPLGPDGCPVLPAGVHGEQGRFGNGTMCSTFRNSSIADLTNMLETFVAMEDGGMFSDHAHIVDQTGLSGEYDFTLNFGMVMRFPGQQTQSADPGTGPTIAAALEKQLGLRLRKTTSALDLIVVDHAEKTPAEN
jgi:uncharacterized protein (TIGR03435 family)